VRGAQAERRVPAAFLAVMLGEGGGARQQGAWEALLRRAVGAAGGTALEEFPGVWAGRLGALDVLLQPALLQRALVRAPSGLFMSCSSDSA